MRFAFRALPAASGGVLTPRPVVDIALEGLEAAPIACLLDTGALRTRMSAELAPLAGIELPGVPWARHETPIERALSQRPAVVRANPGHRAHLAINIAERVEIGAAYNLQQLAGGQLAQRNESFESHVR